MSSGENDKMENNDFGKTLSGADQPQGMLPYTQDLSDNRESFGNASSSFRPINPSVCASRAYTSVYDNEAYSCTTGVYDNEAYVYDNGAYS